MKINSSLNNVPEQPALVWDDKETKESKHKDAGEVVRVSIAEAGKLFGVSTQTIRRAIRDKEVIYIIVAGRYKINFESLVKWSQEKTTVRNKMQTRGIGQYVDKWKIKNTFYSPRMPKTDEQIKE